MILSIKKVFPEDSNILKTFKWMYCPLNNIVLVSCGFSHTAIVDEEGNVWTFGEGFFGWLGHGNKKVQYIPKKIEGVYNIVQVFCGYTADRCVWFPSLFPRLQFARRPIKHR